MQKTLLINGWWYIPWAEQNRGGFAEDIHPRDSREYPVLCKGLWFYQVDPVCLWVVLLEPRRLPCAARTEEEIAAFVGRCEQSS